MGFTSSLPTKPSSRESSVDSSESVHQVYLDQDDRHLKTKSSLSGCKDILPPFSHLIFNNKNNSNRYVSFMRLLGTATFQLKVEIRGL